MSLTNKGEFFHNSYFVLLFICIESMPFSPLWLNTQKYFSGVERKKLISNVLYILFLGGHESLERHAEDDLFSFSTSLLLDYIEEISSLWPRLCCNRQESMTHPATLSPASPRAAGVSLHGEHRVCLYFQQIFPLDGHSRMPAAGC